MAKAEKILEGERLLRGTDVMLPKYVISAGRGLNQSEAHLSMARLYFRNMDEVLAAIKEDGIDPDLSYIGDKPATYIGFILQSVSESRTEKVQTLPLAGDSFHSTFFGEMPRQYVFSGMLFNSKNARWREAFERLYDNYLRGYKSAGEGRPVQIIYDNKIVSGWITNLSQQVTSANEMLAPFNMTLQVIRDTPLTPVSKIIDTVESYSHEHTGPRLGIEDTKVNLGPDDYIRKASISLPKRAYTSSVTGRCRVKDPNKTRNNKTQKTAAPQGPVKSKSPTTDSCDMAEAVVYHLKSIEAAEEKLSKIPRSKANAAKRKAQNRIKNRAMDQLKRLQGWAENKDVKGYNRLNQLGSGAGGASGLIRSARNTSGTSRTVNSATLKEKLRKIKGS
jgi:hypothetical protein